MTDRRPRHAPRISLSAREWKLYVVGGLGLVYAASLAAIGTRAESAAPEPGAAPLTTANVSQPAVVWLDQLPVTQRPNVSVPPDWTIASSARPAAPGPSYPTAAAAPSGASRMAAAAPRVMTRTS